MSAIETRPVHGSELPRAATMGASMSEPKTESRVIKKYPNRRLYDTVESRYITLADIRRLVQGLRPAALDDLGLTGALSARIATVNLGESTETPLLVSLDAPADLGPLPAAVEVAIYRIVDEALANVVHHAHATRCVVRIARTPRGIAVTVEDDGIGIPPGRISGVGLQSMRERALELGGTFRIEPVEPSGARITAELPVGTAT